MFRFISILRGINVGGHRKILMADLKELYLSLGFEDVRTYIQSGNVGFTSKKNVLISELEQLLEKAIFEKFGFDVPVLVRNSEEIQLVEQQNPFLNDADEEQLHVTFLGSAVSENQIENLKLALYLPDKCVVIGKEAFICCAGKYSDSKLTNKFFESKLKMTATTRNWKTVKQLVLLAK